MSTTVTNKFMNAENINKINTVGIIGMGKVGSCIATFLNENSFSDKNNLPKLSWICSKYFTNYSIFPSLKIFKNINEINEIPDAIIICKSDNFIKKTSDDLANYFKEKLAGKFIIHCAGSFGIELLSECKKYDARTVAAHPFQTFLTNDSFNDFNSNSSENLQKSKKINSLKNCLKNISWGIECEKNDDFTVANFIKSLNGNPVFLPEKVLKNKAFYHTVAVAASNYLATSIYFAGLLADEIGINKNDFLKPIINQTVQNSFVYFDENSKQFPITGPIVRSNFDTISKHLEALKNDETLLNSYSYFGFALLELAQNSNILTQENYFEIKKIFQEFMKNK